MRWGITRLTIFPNGPLLGVKSNWLPALERRSFKSCLNYCLLEQFVQRQEERRLSTGSYLPGLCKKSPLRWVAPPIVLGYLCVGRSHCVSHLIGNKKIHCQGKRHTARACMKCRPMSCASMKLVATSAGAHQRPTSGRQVSQEDLIY